MSATEAYTGYDSDLQLGDGGSPESFTSIGEITNIDPPEFSRNMIEATHLKSDDEFAEHIPGIKRLGTISLTLNHVATDTGQSSIQTDYDNGTLRNFKIILSDTSTTTLSFAAYVQNYKIGGIDADGKVEMTVTLQPSGAGTWS